MEDTRRGSITDGVNERLARLERGMRLWSALGPLVVVVAGALLLMGLAPSGPPIVAAQRFVVVDANGTPQASFGLVGENSPMIAFNDKNGVTRVKIGIVDGQPEVTLTSSDGMVSWKAR